MSASEMEYKQGEIEFPPKPTNSPKIFNDLRRFRKKLIDEGSQVVRMQLKRPEFGSRILKSMFPKLFLLKCQQF